MSREAFDRPALYLGIAVYVVLTYLTLAFGSGVARLMVPGDHYAETVGALWFLAASVLTIGSVGRSDSSGGSSLGRTES